MLVVDKVLIADDEPDVRNLAKMILERAGYQVVTASNGVEAEEKTESELPDAVLLDIVMPRKGGFDVCRAIKGQDKTRFIPVIMFSVLSREVDRNMGKLAGAEGHMTKPFTADDLVSEIKSQIETSRVIRFSKALDLEHSQLAGRKILLEFDSSIPYERAVRDFILEGRAHSEMPIVITHPSSAVHNSLKDEDGVELVPFTIPLVLSRILDPYGDKELCFVFDSMSDLIMSAGFQSAYNFVRDTLPRLSRASATALFLINPNSHVLTEVQSIRNLFRDQLVFDEEGLRKVRLS
jgi:CheY-like chemotaxis protein